MHRKNGHQAGAARPIIEQMRASLYDSVGESADLLLPELAEMFLDDAPVLIDELDKAVAAREAAQAREAAHSLKGSSISMGLSHFADLCNEIEQQAKTADLAAAETKMNELKSEFEQIAGTLREFVAH